MSRIISESFDTVNWDKFPDNVLHADGNAFKRLAIRYIDEARQHSKNARFIIDKKPNNYLFLGIIKLALPDAKVIHCTRNPADTGLSIFKSYFPNEGNLFAYDMLEVGGYFNLYSDLMKHWQNVVPGFIYDTRYEDMVSNQAEQTRALLEYCDLEWDDSCLEFFETDKPVMTASAAQVRRPIYKDSVQLWKQYEAQLTPMLESLRKHF